MNIEEIWNEIEELTTIEKLNLIEETVRSIKGDLEKNSNSNQNINSNI